MLCPAVHSPGGIGTWSSYTYLAQPGSMMDTWHSSAFTQPGHHSTNKTQRGGQASTETVWRCHCIPPVRKCPFWTEKAAFRNFIKPSMRESMSASTGAYLWKEETDTCRGVSCLSVPDGQSAAEDFLGPGGEGSVGTRPPTCALGRGPWGGGGLGDPVLGCRFWGPKKLFGALHQK